MKEKLSILLSIVILLACDIISSFLNISVQEMTFGVLVYLLSYTIIHGD